MGLRNHLPAIWWEQVPLLLQSHLFRSCWSVSWQHPGLAVLADCSQSLCWRPKGASRKGLVHLLHLDQERKQTQIKESWVLTCFTPKHCACMLFEPAHLLSRWGLDNLWDKGHPQDHPEHPSELQRFEMAFPLELERTSVGTAVVHQHLIHNSPQQ